jgi:transcriptional regulator with XRE-family HTH domain
MSAAIATLLQQLIEAAKAQGISQGELAERVGLSAVGLSKAKGRGDIRASSLAAMAEVVGLELTLTPRQPKHDAIAEVRRGSLFRRER